MVPAQCRSWCGCHRWSLRHRSRSARSAGVSRRFHCSPVSSCRRAIGSGGRECTVASTSDGTAVARQVIALARLDLGNSSAVARRHVPARRRCLPRGVSVGQPSCLRLRRGEQVVVNLPAGEVRPDDLLGARPMLIVRVCPWWAVLWWAGVYVQTSWLVSMSNGRMATSSPARAPVRSWSWMSAHTWPLTCGLTALT
jgi:hypothetical protein